MNPHGSNSYSTYTVGCVDPPYCVVGCVDPPYYTVFFLFHFVSPSDMKVKLAVRENQCCGAGAGGSETIWDLEPEPEPKLNF